MGHDLYMKSRISVKLLSCVYIGLSVFAVVVESHAQEQATVTDINGHTVYVDTAIFTRSVKELEEIIVTPKKRKYSKKNNPAVELMQRIRKGSSGNNPEKEPFFSYDQYDKIILALNDFETVFKPDSKKSFMEAYVDTAPTTSKRLLDISIKEKASTLISRRDPRCRKSIVTGIRNAGIDDAFNQENIRKMLEDVLREIDVYSNAIPLAQNRFVSPLSDIASDFYRYFITDTIVIDSHPYVELNFSPSSPETPSFYGKMYVDPADSLGFVRRIEMRVPRYTNLNFIDQVHITQEFIRDTLGNRHKVLDDMSLELQLVSGTPSFYGRRITARDNFSYEERDDMIEYYEVMSHNPVSPEAEMQDISFWNKNRFVAMKPQELALDGIHQEMKKLPLFYYGEKALKILSVGYVGTSRHDLPSKFDIGPVNTFVSFNTVEGLRLRFGGLTKASLNPHWFARGYLAYGIKDRKFKYGGELEYSFIEKKEHSREFPVNSFRLSYTYDLDRIGQRYFHTNPDNFFLSLKRKDSNLTTYRHLAEFSYQLEMENNFSLKGTLSHQIQEATDWVEFRFPSGKRLAKYSQSGASIMLRYAPGEVFSQSFSNRLPVNMDAPIFILTQEYSPKGVFGNRWNIITTEFSVSKRFWFSAFGYLDTMLKGGMIWSAVPFPALLWPNSNLSYTIQPESFSLLNPMEFANDKYFALDMTYWANGVLLNRIPLIKRLKLREIVSFKLLMGGLSDRNDPSCNKDLLIYPPDGLCQRMSPTPYMEIGAGLGNILKVLRIDYVWRLTYRNTPGAPNSGLRVAVHLSF